METRSVSLLAKVGQREHIQNLRCDGVLYCNSVQHFQGLEDNNLRGDPLENCTAFYPPDKVETKINGRVLTALAGPIREYIFEKDQYQASHLFCMLAIYEGLPIRADRKIFDPKITRFGDTILIVEPRPFRDRVLQAVKRLQRQGRKVSFSGDGLVKYVRSSDIQQSMSILDKVDQYEWQQEYRLIFRTDDDRGDPLLLKIGDISDISSEVAMKDFINRVEQTPEGNLNLLFD